MKNDFAARIKSSSDPQLDIFISVMEKHLPKLQSRLAAARRERKRRNKAKVKS